MASQTHSLEELRRVNSEIERFDVSEAAEQLEAMAAEAEMDKGNIVELIKRMENHRSEHQDVTREEIELSIYKAKECSAVQLERGSPLPLHPTSIKLESGRISEP